MQVYIRHLKQYIYIYIYKVSRLSYKSQLASSGNSKACRTQQDLVQQYAVAFLQFLQPLNYCQNSTQTFIVVWRVVVVKYFQHKSVVRIKQDAIAVMLPAVAALFCHTPSVCPSVCGSPWIRNTQRKKSMSLIPSLVPCAFVLIECQQTLPKEESALSEGMFKKNKNNSFKIKWNWNSWNSLKQKR